MMAGSPVTVCQRDLIVTRFLTAAERLIRLTGTSAPASGGGEAVK